jgi:hypothetical protein
VGKFTGVIDCAYVLPSGHKMQLFAWVMLVGFFLQRRDFFLAGLAQEACWAWQQYICILLLFVVQYIVKPPALRAAPRAFGDVLMS